MNPFDMNADSIRQRLMMNGQRDPSTMMAPGMNAQAMMQHMTSRGAPPMLPSQMQAQPVMGGPAMTPETVDPAKKQQSLLELLKSLQGAQ